MITLKADNSTTPAAGDTIDFYVLPTCGDPDGSGSAEYPNDEKDGIFLATLDTTDNDPAIATVPFPIACTNFKLYAKSNASTNAITVSACVNEKTG
jgi:hypothetical protein